MSLLENDDTTTPPPDDDSPIPDDEEEDGEDLINEHMAEDYKSIDELDNYDDAAIDNTNYNALDVKERKNIEALMDERDRRLGIKRRTFVPHALMSPEQDEEIPISLDHRKGIDLSQTEELEEGFVNLEDFRGSVLEFLEEDRVRREVKNRFRKFLTGFVDNSGHQKYLQRIATMCSDNKCSLEISFMDLRHYSVLPIWTTSFPSIMLELFDEATMNVAKYQFPDYDKIHSHIYVRVSNLPLTDQLRELRQLHLNSFIQVDGVVTRRTNIFPQLLLIKYDCLKCGFIIGPFAQRGNTEPKPPSCPDCQSAGPFRLNEQEAIYRNYQKICLQESPGSVPAGRIPRSRDVILIDDLCDSIRPGEQIRVTGIYKNVFEPSINAQQGFPVFATIIQANHITKEKDYYSNFTITDEDRNEILKLSKRSDIENIIVNSIAPSIYGHDYVKRSIAYSLFGGEEKKHQNKHRVRGDINILILGDPGVAKSQFLRYVEAVAFRAVYATGKGASAVGLTASVRRDTMTREWTLEGGALVLADRGVCCIDEFDKMNDQDRTSIHEAMEQQSISISKAGIVATLQARCAIIAAANPIRGRYDNSLTFMENVDLTDPILSRFDILAVIRDKVDPIQDEMLADFVVGNHIRSHPNFKENHVKETENENENENDENENDENKNNQNQNKIKTKKEKENENEDNKIKHENKNKNKNKSKNKNENEDASYMILREHQEKEQISQEMLRKYILYAKRNCHPKLDNIDRDKVSKFYADLRQKSMDSGGIPIAVRHIESILRLAEARCKLHLREFVRDDDIDMAISVLLESFIKTQKQSVQTNLRKHFQTYLTYQHDVIELLLYLLENEVREEINWRHIRNKDDDNNEKDAPVIIDLKEFQAKAEAIHISNLTDFFNSQRFKAEGFVLQGKEIIKNFR